MASLVGKNALLLGSFALVCTTLIVIVQRLTEERIQLEQNNAFAQQLSDVLPTYTYDNILAQDCVLAHEPLLLRSSKPLKIYRARKAGEPVAVIMETIAPDGYSGEIRLLMGIYTNGKLSGVRVTAHKETPGLGDKVEANKHPWITQFSGLSLNQDKNWAVKKDGGQFDAFAGATITPRAVLTALKHSQQYFAKIQTDLFSAANACEHTP